MFFKINAFRPVKTPAFSAVADFLPDGCIPERSRKRQ